MSWRDDITAAQARLTALEAAELKVMTGEQVRIIMYDGEKLEFQQGASPEQLRRAIFEVRAIIARLGGGRMGGAIVPVMGR